MAGRDRSPDIANIFFSWFRWIAGAAFPANPFLYRLFFRTDLGWLCYWDGTQWLTVHVYTINQFQTTYAATTAAPSASLYTFVDNYAPYIERITIITDVLTTNDATNRWTYEFRGYNLAFTVNTSIYTINTGATPDTANTLTDHNAAAAGLSSSTPANNRYLAIVATKINAPGNLIVQWTLSYRLIVT